VTNQIIREALHPYPADLRIVTKVGARRDAQGGWPPALAPEELRQAVHENLTNLGLETLDVVNLRVGGLDSPTPGSIAAVHDCGKCFNAGSATPRSTTPSPPR